MVFSNIVNYIDLIQFQRKLNYTNVYILTYKFKTSIHDLDHDVKITDFQNKLKLNKQNIKRSYTNTFRESQYFYFNIRLTVYW